MDTQHIESIVEHSTGEEVKDIRSVSQDSGPHVETSTGVVAVTVDAQNPAEPIVEHASAPPPIVPLEKKTGSVSDPQPEHSSQVSATLSATHSSTVDPIEFFKDMSMPAEMQSALAAWQADSARLNSLLANQTMRGLIVLAEKMLNG